MATPMQPEDTTSESSGETTLSLRARGTTVSTTSAGHATEATLSTTSAGDATEATLSKTSSGHATEATLSKTSPGRATKATLSSASTEHATEATLSTTSGQATEATSGTTYTGHATEATLSTASTGHATEATVNTTTTGQVSEATLSTTSGQATEATVSSASTGQATEATLNTTSTWQASEATLSTISTRQATAVTLSTTSAGQATQATLSPASTGHVKEATLSRASTGQASEATLSTKSSGQHDVVSVHSNEQTSASSTKPSISPNYAAPVSQESTACVLSESTTVTRDNAMAVFLGHSMSLQSEQVPVPVDSMTSEPLADPVASTLKVANSTPRFDSSASSQVKEICEQSDGSFNAPVGKALPSAMDGAPDKATHTSLHRSTASSVNAVESENTCSVPQEDTSHTYREESSPPQDKETSDLIILASQDHNMTSPIDNENGATSVAVPVPPQRSSPVSSDYGLPAPLDGPPHTQSVKSVATPLCKGCAPPSGTVADPVSEGTPELSTDNAVSVPSADTVPTPTADGTSSISFEDNSAFLLKESPEEPSFPDVAMLTTITETKTDCCDKASSAPLVDTSPAASENLSSTPVDILVPQDTATLTTLDEGKSSHPDDTKSGPVDDKTNVPSAATSRSTPEKASLMPVDTPASTEISADTPQEETSHPNNVALASSDEAATAQPGDSVLDRVCQTTPALLSDTISGPSNTTPAIPDKADLLLLNDNTDLPPLEAKIDIPPSEVQTDLLPLKKATQAVDNVSHQEDHGLGMETLPTNLPSAKPDISSSIFKPIVSVDSSSAPTEIGVSQMSPALYTITTRPSSPAPPGKESYAPIASMARMVAGSALTGESSSHPQPQTSVSAVSEPVISSGTCLPLTEPISKSLVPLDKASSREPDVDTLEQQDKSALTIKSVCSEITVKKTSQFDKPVIDLDDAGNSRDLSVITDLHHDIQDGHNQYPMDKGSVESQASRLNPDDCSAEMENTEENNLVRSIFCLSRPADPVPQTSSSTCDMQYSLPSEAERQEEMLAMRRDCVEDPMCMIPNSSLRALPEPERGLANSVCASKTNICEKRSSPVVIKAEAQDTTEAPISKSDSATQSSSIPNYPVQHDNTIHTQPSNGLSSNTLLFTSLTTGVETSQKTVSVIDTNVSQACDTGTTTASTLASLLQSKFSTLREQQVDCLVDTDNISTYTSPAVPEKFKDKFSGSKFKCIGCEDSFLFASSLEFHLNRKTMQIVCKHEKCQAQVKVFTNRCAFASHLKSHGTMAENVDFTVSAADSEMLDKFPDMVTQCDSKSNDGVGFPAQWKCMECDLLLSSAEALATHFVPKIISGLEGAECGICNKHFWTKCALSAHCRTHSHDKPYICPECGQQFLGTWSAFSKHLGLKCFHTCRTSTFKCPRCKLSLASCDEMVEHLMSHKESYYKCANCPMAFKTHASLVRHMQSAHNDNMTGSTFIFKCSVCDTVFHNAKQMVGHTNLHVIEHNKIQKCAFACWFCKQLFDEKIGLEKHLNTNHSVVYSTIICDLCGEHLSSIEALFCHLEKHEETDPPLCVVDQTETVGGCEKVTKTPKKKNSTKKVKSPTKMGTPALRMFRCSVCDFQCSKTSVAEVHAHIIKHRQEGIFLCPICFTAKLDDLTDLRRHQFLCRKKKNTSKGSPKAAKDSFICSKCDKTFCRDEDLQNHMQCEHAMGPQFPCHLCGLTYDTRNNLQQHIQVVHEGKKNVYLCWICQSKNIKRTFTIAPKLTKHLVTKHRVPRNTIDPEKFPRVLPGLDDKDTVVPGSSKRSGGVDTNKAPIKRLKVVGDVVFNCAKCKFSSEDKDEFKGHIKEHKTETDSKQCPECGLCFSVLPSLKKHLIMVHKIEDVNNYVEASSINESAGLDPLSLKPGTMSPEPDASQEMDSGNPLECRVCYKAFDTVALLRSHMRTHGMAFIRSKRAVTSPSQ